MRSVMWVASVASISSAPVMGCASYETVTDRDRVVRHTRVAADESPASFGGDDETFTLELRDGRRLAWPAGTRATRLGDGWVIDRGPATQLETVSALDLAAIEIDATEETTRTRRVKHANTPSTGVTVLIVVGTVVSVAGLAWAISSIDDSLDGIGNGLGGIGAGGFGNGFGF